MSAVCQRALEHAVRQTRARDWLNPNLGLPPGFELPGPATPRLAQVFALAQEEAAQRSDGVVGTEHLLLGILDQGANMAVHAIVSLDVVPDDLRVELYAAMRGRRGGICADYSGPHLAGDEGIGVGSQGGRPTAAQLPWHFQTILFFIT